jgi:excisionase family DNA binding protein
MALRIISAPNSTNSTKTTPYRFIGDEDSPSSGYLVLLTSAEAAAFLGIRKETLAIWRCTKRYNIPFIRCGRLIKYRKSALIAFLESRSSEVVDVGK